MQFKTKLYRTSYRPQNPVIKGIPRSTSEKDVKRWLDGRTFAAHVEQLVIAKGGPYNGQIFRISAFSDGRTMVFSAKGFTGYYARGKNTYIPRNSAIVNYANWVEFKA